MKTLFDLFTAFFRVGILTFGGGYAMIPILEKEVVEKYHWSTENEMMDYYAVSQCTPGIISVNTATFIGYKVAGDIGGIVATLGVVFPSLIIISLIAGIISNFADIPAVQHAFGGIRVCVCVLIFNSVIKLFKSGVKDKFALCIFLAVFTVSVFFNVSPVIFVIISAVTGIIIKNMGGKK